MAIIIWQKKVNKKLKLKALSRMDTPYKMTVAKRNAQMWAVFFHTMETLDLVTGVALFFYLQDRETIRDTVLLLYWLAVTVGLLLTFYRLYKVLWSQFYLESVSVEEKVDADGKLTLVVYQSSSCRKGLRDISQEDAMMTTELIKILKHLQVNKFKVQLAVVMDLPLTFLNLHILWFYDFGLIQNPIFLTSLTIAVFSAGKISTLIEYHLELRQRKRKLERLLALELRVHPAGGRNEEGVWEGESSETEEEGNCFEHGDPEAMLLYHQKASMGKIPTRGAEQEVTTTSERGRQLKRGKYLQLSPRSLSPKGPRRGRPPTGSASSRLGQRSSNRGEVGD
ncbi:unnamed protein product [Choristocarpus tenellus]